MSSFGIAQLNMSSQLALAIATGQRQLAQAQTEVSTGVHADLGLFLGSGTADDITWRRELTSLQQIADGNKLTQARASLTQDSLKAINDIATSFLSTLAGAQTASNGQDMAKQAAETAYEQLVSLAGTTFDGQYIFGGLNSQRAPLADYQDSAAQAAVAAAFQANFGFVQSDTASQTIQPAAMQSFLDGAFKAEFESPHWQQNWSSASDETPYSRIDVNQTASPATTVNAAAFRELAQALTMVADLGEPGLSQPTFQTIATKALALTASAQSDLANEETRIGLAQSALTSASDAIEQRINTLSRNIANAESVDKYAAASTANALMTQLEASYTLTGRISQLSILKFI